jgi:phage/plasmid-like protein (TIGR03299 family)
MSDEIFGERFLGHRTTLWDGIAWHKKGKTFEAPLGAEEAIIAGDMDIPYELQPVAVKIGDRWVEQKNKVAVVRAPTHDDDVSRIFGYVNPDYGLLQNVDIGKILNPLTEEWPVETVGMLYEGKKIFITMKSGERDVNGDPVEQYFLFTDSKTGNEAAKFAFTPVRVVCKNTLIVGLRQAVIVANLTHHSQIADELKWRTGLLEQMQETQALIMENFEAMARCNITERQAKEIFEAAYPMPVKSARLQLAEETGETSDAIDKELARHVRWTEIVEKRRTDTMTVYEKFNDEVEADVQKTAWAAYNAVVEWEDFRGTGNIMALQSALFGDRASKKKNAFAKALSITLKN